MPAKSEKISFEAALERLEVITKMLEDGNITLDNSLDLYKEGIQLIKSCNKMLESAESKIKTINKTDVEQ